MERQDRTRHWSHAAGNRTKAARLTEPRLNTVSVNVAHDRFAARVNPHVDHDRAWRYMLAAHQATHARSDHEHGGGGDGASAGL